MHAYIHTCTSILSFIHSYIHTYIRTVISDARKEVADALSAKSSLEEALKAVEMDRNGLRLTNEDLLVSLRFEEECIYVCIYVSMYL